MEKIMMEKLNKYRWVADKVYSRTAEVWNAYLKNTNTSYASTITPNVVNKMLDYYDDELAKIICSPGTQIPVAWARMVGFELSGDDFDMMIMIYDRVKKAIADDILSGKITFRVSKGK